MTDNKSMPPPQKKRKRSSQGSVEKIPQVPTAPLPPPLVPYHPHLVPSYFPVYHQHPYYLSVGPQPPVSPSLSPTTTKSSPVQRILPKSPTSQPHIISPGLGPTFYPVPIQLSPQPNTAADQREQARKLSHSAIERRRRERINDKIVQLKELIPSCADRDNLHKMTILQSAIDYIIYLKQIAGEQSESKVPAKKEINELEEEDDWSNPLLLSPTQQTHAIPAGLKPMDIMNLSNKTTPSIQVDSDQALGKDHLDRNMNLENILC
ncbi:Upstream stimulatory factor 2 [Choanephora cucurbitarum]|uniref:Upstream stimulatory factor 2 n=1 Tax=Choanephora cucurbitarum TaxID=101091 RepID=A0A1C7NK02_9FUNG|nr:Upstream stimulatory factor 2 [Choanephora cucurbitarum]